MCELGTCFLCPSSHQEIAQAVSGDGQTKKHFIEELAVFTNPAIEGPERFSLRRSAFRGPFLALPNYCLDSKVKKMHTSDCNIANPHSSFIPSKENKRKILLKFWLLYFRKCKKKSEIL